MPVWPDDVFRRPWNWRAITRDEACALSAQEKVIVVSRPNGPARVAEWFTPGGAFYSSSRPYLFKSLRYFVLVGDEEPRLRGVRTPGTDGAGPDEPDDDVVPQERPDRAPRMEEEEPETLSQNADHVAIADVLTKAAQNGIPFCEECARRR